MFPTIATAHNVSICLRFQYQFSVLQRTRPRLPLIRLVSRLLTSRPSTNQQILQHKDLTLSDENIFENSPRDQCIPRTENFNKHQKAFLDINALGKPGEVLVMADDLPEKEEDNAFEKKEVVEGNVAMDASQIIDKMDGEIGVVGSERVAENLENIRLTWRQDRSKVPTVPEFEELGRTLYDGFTKRQLLHYFLVQSSRHLDSQLELLSACSTDIYKRSHWSPGSTPFPGDALRRLDVLRAEIEAKKGSSRVLRPSVKHSKISSNKHLIVDQILRQRWHLRTQEDLKSSGELDIWLSRDHLKLLLNHRRELLRSLAQQYDTKIDASRSYAVLRVTADFDTCGEVFKSIIYLLENIHMNEINLSLDEFSVGEGAQREDVPMRLLLDQVEKVTNTVIKPLFKVRIVNAFKEKLRIYHLGPGDEDLEDVRRVLSHALRRAAPKTSFAFWTGDQKLQNSIPLLTETEKGLPLVKRGRQWARWSGGIRRKPDSANKLSGLKRTDDTKRVEKKILLGSRDSGSIKSAQRMHGQILKILIGQARDNSLMNGSSIPSVSDVPTNRPSLEAGRPPDSFWARSPARKTSALFGHVLYPLSTSDKMKTGRKGPNTDPVLKNNQTFFNSRREFLTSITSARSYLQKSRLSNIEESEELRIMLTPAQKTDLAGPTRVFPGLVLYVRIDPDTKKPSLAEVRLILEDREVDLLLPDEAADIRFSAESFLPAAGGIDPEIINFFEASYLDVTGHRRLRTPKNLTLLVPKHAIRTFSADSSESTTANTGLRESAKPDVPVEYTFTGLEHWSVIAGFDTESGFRVQYSIVEAGETGGRRDELRMMFVKQEPKVSKGRDRGRLRNADDDHRHGDEGEGQPVVKRQILKSFYHAAISLV